MARFPVLTLVGYVLRGAAILCAIIGLIAVRGGGLIALVGLEGLALTLWVYAEVTGVVLSIEANTFDSKQALESLARSIDRNGLSSAATYSVNAVPSASIPLSGRTHTTNQSNRTPARASKVAQPSRSPVSFLAELDVSGSSQSPNSTSATLAYDGNPETSWETNESSPPTSAFAVFDLNMVRHIGEIAWTFSQPC
jgi:hypothetical protein